MTERPVERPGAAERPQESGAAAPGRAPGRGGRMSRQRKRDAVLRLLRGEDLEAVSRALVEADISRWKQVVGDGLRFQTDGRQATEVAIAAEVLNRMLDLGRPNYVRIA